jgi:heterodisulfide reductase subunit A
MAVKDRYETIKGFRPGRANVGAVLVVGGGIGGIQASLDLVGSGYKVYLVESAPAIGGVMARLDKTFPTNDCAMCILAPKLVECGRDANIELLTLSEVEAVRGRAGNFTVVVNRKPRYIDEALCTGCGDCAQNCPTRAINEFNEGLDSRASVYVQYPQAVPRSFVIDREKCIGCGLCQNVCLAKAVDFEDEQRGEELKVGAVVLVPGIGTFDPSSKRELGYGLYPNVVTSTEFERILSASGPYEGEVLRPSDGAHPTKIAWVQCVGSRDCRAGREYCSSVCCTYALKQAMIAKEHAPDIEPAILFMDERTPGKGFERYLNRARDEHAMRLIRSRVSHIQEDPETSDLMIKYEVEAGVIEEERFDMAVLSVGLEPPREAEQIAEVFGIDLNRYRFADTVYLSPLETSVPGVFVAGGFQGPQDIPETVVQASGAACRVSGLLSEARNTLTVEKEYPEQVEVTADEPRVGVFVCHCGINIGGIVKVPEVVEYAKALPGVAYVEENLYTCSDDTQQAIAEKIREHNLTRVVVASCTPRTHEPLFQETLRNAGLNPYLFEMANIREHDSWAHRADADAATAKAKDLVRMAAAKAALLEPLEELKVPVTRKALVLGGGVAGMLAALDIAEQGFDAVLVERDDELGGYLRNLYYVSEVGDIQAYLNSLRTRVMADPRIEVLLRTRLEELSGFVGNFQSTLVSEGDGGPTTRDVEHGVVVVATGGGAYRPSQFLYGEDPRVVTQVELESMIMHEEVDWTKLKNVVMIQCVGSRDEEHPYCSKICCAQAVKNANMILGHQPEAQVYVMYRDLRTYGFREHYYNVARERGTVFIRYDEDNMPVVEVDDGRLLVEADDPILRERFRIPADLLVLSTGVVASEGNEELAKQLKVPLDEDGFFLEAHVKLRPVDFATEGIFLAGLAHSPRTLDECITQAHAAASHASVLLAKGEVTVEPITAVVDEEECIGCGLCVSLCPYSAMELVLKEGGKKSQNIPASCKGCGTCAASCPQQAITMRHFTDRALIAQVEAVVA